MVCLLTYWHVRNSVLNLETDRDIFYESESLGFVFRRRYQIDATGFVPVPFIQLGDHLNQPTRHGLEAPLSVAGNGVAALICDHIAIPDGALPVGRRLCSLD